MKPFIKITSFVVILITVSGIMVAFIMNSFKHPDLVKTKPDFVITASALQKAFEDDEKAASGRFLNKIIEVNGTIESVKPANDNVLNISLVTNSAMSSVICTFPVITEPSKFKAGDKITLRGACSGFLMDVLLNNCAVIH